MMSPSNSQKASNSQAKFVEAIQGLRETDRGRFAALKRNCGNSLAKARGDVFWFYGWLECYLPPNSHESREEIYWLVATLIGHNPYSFQGNLGKSLAVLAQRTRREPVERRFLALLDCEVFPDQHITESELAFRLRQTIRLLASKEIGVDWVQLLNDLERWHSPERSVQKCWARQFYGSEELEAEDAYQTANNANIPTPANDSP
jgi:CRISPR system Cascade subunit CasB